MNINKAAYFTTSWDDGSPDDLRVANLLAKYNLHGTFYVPIRNMEARDVLQPQLIRELNSSFEIGSHTLDHCYLNTVNLNEAKRQIFEGKERLEQILNSSVNGFCYPGGRKNFKIIKMVEDAGFSYARALTNLNTDAGAKYGLPTTIQFYPHSPDVYVKNFLSKGRLFSRRHLLPVCIFEPALKSRISKCMHYVAKNGGVFHLWGHSWEIDLFDGWKILEEIFYEAHNLFDKKNILTNYSISNINMKIINDKSLPV